MAEISIASAITVPDAEKEESPDANPLKRRHSGAPEEQQEQEQENKRQRISPGKNSPPEGDGVDSVIEQTKPEDDAKPPSDQSTTETRAARKQARPADEKQRSKRLFGALLGNLNQPGDRTSKRRQEIESRRKAELQRQDDEHREDRLRKQEELAELRRKEQVRVDEENMRIRHDNMLHAANFLQTTAEPRLYYRPWDLRPDEEDRIEQQTREAQDRIDQELDDFERLHPDRERPERQLSAAEHSPIQERDMSPTAVRGSAHQPSSPEATKGSAKRAGEEDQAAAKSDDSKPAEVPDLPAAATAITDHDTNATETSSLTPKKDQSEEVDDGGEDVGDADEDTVIY